MIKDSKWNWPLGWINRVLELGNLSVPVLHNDVADKVIWKNNNGNEVDFSVGRVWKDTRECGSKVRWSKVVWFSQCVPSHAFILWLAMRDRMQTQDRMAKWCPATDFSCMSCDKQSDSMDHLFFRCEYSNYIWEEMKEYIEDKTIPNSWKDVKDWIIRKKSNNSAASVIQRLIVAACVYMIWKERNTRLFSKTQMPKEKVRDKIIEVVKIRFIRLRFKDGDEYNKVKKKWNIV
uniref:uncharacterized protein LOC122580603 n=1 Tax=Erigeron canadensis TaxID=72917 RepID=UPI001CB95F01|nr:uncharacterized protein LOC122580603 [Erigeron canadensis]